MVSLSYVKEADIVRAFGLASVHMGGIFGCCLPLHWDMVGRVCLLWVHCGRAGACDAEDQFFICICLLQADLFHPKLWVGF